MGVECVSDNLVINFVIYCICFFELGYRYLNVVSGELLVWDIFV